MKEDKYKQVLKSSIFCIKAKNIIKAIKLFEEYGISEYINASCLRKNVKLQRDLIKYLIENNISLIVERNGRLVLNPILSASTSAVKNKYHLDIKNLPLKEGKRL